MVCKYLGKEDEICDLEGLGMAKDACKCRADLMCSNLDLTAFLGTIAPDIHNIFNKHH